MIGSDVGPVAPVSRCRNFCFAHRRQGSVRRTPADSPSIGSSSLSWRRWPPTSREVVVRVEMQLLHQAPRSSAVSENSFNSSPYGVRLLVTPPGRSVPAMQPHVVEPLHVRQVVLSDREAEFRLVDLDPRGGALVEQRPRLADGIAPAGGAAPSRPDTRGEAGSARSRDAGRPLKLAGNCASRKPSRWRCRRERRSAWLGWARRRSWTLRLRPERATRTFLNISGCVNF